MAVTFPTTSDYLKRTSGTFLDPTQDITIMGWFWTPTTALTSGQYRLGWQSQATALADYVRISQVDTQTLTFTLYNGSAHTISGPVMTTQTWYHAAITYNHTSHVWTGYVNGVSQGTVTVDFSAVTFVEEDGGGDGTGQAKLAMAYIRVWQQLLTPTQINTELASPTPVVLTNLFTNTPLPSDANVADTSGNAHNWTKIGSPTLRPMVLTPASPTVVSSLPYSTNQAVSGSDTTGVPPCNTSALHFPQWFKHTPTGITALGVHWNSSIPANHYAPVVTVWTANGSGPALDLVSYSVVGGTDSCYSVFDTNGGYASINVTPGTAYYVQVTDSSGMNDANLIFQMPATPNSPAAVGSFVISNDQPIYPLVVLDKSSANVLQVLGLPSYEIAEWLPDGNLAVAAETLTNANVVASLNIYDSTLTLKHTVTSIVTSSPQAVGPMTSDRVSEFYWARITGTFPSYTSTIYAFSEAGVVGSNWDISSQAGGAGAGGIAVSLDRTTLYFYRQTSIAAGTNFGLGSWDLVHNSFIGWIVGPTGTLSGSGRDLLLMPDSTLVFYSPLTAGGQNIYRYNLSGTLLNTYTVTTPGGTPRLQRDPVDGTVFWYMHWPSGSTSNDPVHFTQIRMSDGVVLQDVVGTLSEPGTTSAPQFGPSQSCPLLVTPVMIPPVGRTPTPPPPQPPAPGSPTVRAQRRLRRFSLPFNTNLMMRLQRLEIFAQQGVGLVSGQGVAPVLMLRISRDGGLTWGNEIDMTLGPLGNYGWRTYAQRLGRGRNFVIEITDSDPVFSALLDAFATIEEGTS